MSRTDDLARLLTILGDAPLEGITLEGIQVATERSGGKWPLRLINELMVDLGSQVEHKKQRDKVTGSKVTRYWLRRNS